MTAWATIRRFGIAAASLAAFASADPSAANAAVPFHIPAQWEADAEPTNPTPAPVAKPTPAQLRTRAAAAEKSGDWEAAFAAYCELYVADRAAIDVREKLNAALRRVQQARRHRDPGFQQFVRSLPAGDAINLFAETAAKVPGLFADPTRSTPQHLWANGVEELDRALGSAAFRQTYLDNPTPDKVEAFRKTLRGFWTKLSVADAREARAALKRLVAAAQDAFAVRTPSVLVVEFVCGACSGLDEYTVYVTPDRAAVAPDPAADFGAHGLFVAFLDGGLMVEGVAPGSWAAFHTPLRRGDRIAKVNGRSMEVGPAALAEALRMPVGGFHEVEHVTPNPGLLGLVRFPLAVPTVYGDRMESTKDGIGYVRISEFQPSTPREFSEAVARLKLQGLRALVLDLRGNHGGSFLAGVEVARRLLPAGLIVTTQGQLGQVAGQVFSSDSGMNALDVPLVVLIDTETASAAEVVAAALRDNNRAVLVGMPTFGKGTIQYPLKLSAADDTYGTGTPRLQSGTVRVTIARLISPRGVPINGAGVSPPPHLTEPDPVRQYHLAVEQALELLQPMMPRSPLPLPPSQ